MRALPVANTTEAADFRAFVSSVELESAGAPPLVTPRYTTGAARSGWRTVLTAKLDGTDEPYVQAPGHFHVLHAPGDATAEVFVTMREPSTRAHPHDDGATRRSLGVRIALLFRKITSGGRVLMRSTQTDDDRSERARALDVLIDDVYSATVLHFPDEPIGAGARWRVHAFGSRGERWTSELTLRSVSDDGIVVDARHQIAGASPRELTGTLTFDRSIAVVRRAALVITPKDLPARPTAPSVTVSLSQTPVDVLPGPGWPLGLRRGPELDQPCVTSIGEPGITCGPAMCCNPCLPGMATRGGAECARACIDDSACEDRSCIAGVCSYGEAATCDAPDPCRLRSGEAGSRCGQGPCVPSCRPPKRLIGGTDCVKPCREDADCPGYHCQLDGVPFAYCAGLCPSLGCPYLWE